jgi:hypothetical protein
MIIHGTRGVLRVDLFAMFHGKRASTPLPKAAERLINAFADSIQPLIDVPINVWKFVRKEVQAYQGLRDLVAEFYRRLAAGEPPPVSIDDAAQVVAWVEKVARAADAEQLLAIPWARAEAIFAVPVLCEQGDLAAAEALLTGYEWARDAEQAELRTAFAACEARLLRAQNRPAEALAAAERGLSHRHELGIANLRIRRSLLEALEAALELDDLAKADELLALIDTLQPGQLTPSLQAHRHRFHARLDTRRGSHDQVDHNYCEAEAIFAQHGLAFHHAVTQLERAEWLTSQGRGDEAQLLLGQARETFEQLEAKPWLERLATADAATPTEMLA